MVRRPYEPSPPGGYPWYILDNRLSPSPCRLDLGGGGHTPRPPPSPYPPRPPPQPPPPQSRLPVRGVGPTEERGGGGVGVPAPGYGPRDPRSFLFRPPRLCSVPARRCSGWGQHVSVPPFYARPNRKGRNTFPPSPPMRMRLAVYGDLPTIWLAFAQVKGRMEVLATLNQALMQGLPSCCWFFERRDYFSASLPLLAFVKNVSLLNPSLDPAFTGGRFKPWLTRQGSV